jgi:phage antirepressor YoqD-like protein
MNELTVVGQRRPSDIAAVLGNAVDTISQLTATIEQLKDMAEFGQAVMDDGQCYGFAEAAKMLSPKLRAETGIDIGQNRLIDTLKAMGIIQDNREPYQRYARYFKVVPKQTPVGMRTTSLFTGEGLAWILPRLVEYLHS